MKTFHMTPTLRIGNAMVMPLLRLGVPMGRMSILTVAGRRSGLPRSTPVAVTSDGDGWLLVAAYGRVDWVKNLEAAGRATITRGRREVEVDCQPLSPAEAASVLRDLLAGADPVTRRVVGPYFDARPDSPPEEWQAETARHPVFRLTPR